MLPEFKTILCAHGMEDHFSQIYRHALSLAERYDGKITILHALEPLTSYAQNMLDMYLDHEVNDKMYAEAVERTTRTIGAQLEELGGRERVEGIRVVSGNPGQVLLQEAGTLNADVVVMGSHRHTAMGEILLGSTAHRVTQHATVPVLLVRVTS